MNALLIQGSPRTKSNTGAIVAFLAAQLEQHRVVVDTFRVSANGTAPEDLVGLCRAIAGSTSILLAAPLYVDGLPACTQQLLEDLHARRADGGGVAPLFYGLAHSGFPEPSQRRPAVRTMELFARAMGWRWQGALGFGGTSPIDGRPLEAAGAFAARLRECLPLAAGEIAAGQPFSPRTVAAAERPAFPMPLRPMVWLINARTRRMARGIDIAATPYARTTA
jgi:hypothetical protein